MRNRAAATARAIEGAGRPVVALEGARTAVIATAGHVTVVTITNASRPSYALLVATASTNQGDHQPNHRENQYSPHIDLQSNGQDTYKNLS